MPDLLDVLCERIGGIYLSDLRTREYRLKALEAALELPAEAFPLSQWQEAARYLLDQSDLAATEADIRSRLRGALDEPQK